MPLLALLLLTSLPGALPRVAIDAGHGGSQSGAVGICGVVEKRVTQALATRVHRILARSGLVEPLLLRRGDETVSLAERSQRANAAGAILMLSIHANASPNAEASGVETFFLSQRTASSRLQHLAEFEIDGIMPYGHAGTDAGLTLILQGLRLDAAHTESQALALKVQQVLKTRLRSRGRGVLQAPFRVLVGAQMAAALVEVGFLSNMHECKRLTQPTYQHTVAQALAQAVIMHVAQHHAPALIGEAEAPWAPPQASVGGLR
jgi:N-acetylmuramoyl-L-alanine amidase